LLKFNFEGVGGWGGNRIKLAVFPTLDLSRKTMGDYEPTTGGEEEGAFAEEVADETLFEHAEESRTAVPDPLESLHKFHPETILDYADAVAAKIPIQSAPPDGTAATDAVHRSQPFLTVYERTKILGFRANQLSQGARPFVDVPEYVTKPIEIAHLELEQRRLPFIVKRPMPDGSFEYWRLSDLIVI
jgi:DNA-directed RNA polymerase I, II, and III subunit RPABC2